MNENLTATEEQEFQDALDAMPEEVRDYMWSPAFDYAIDVAEKVIELTPQEKEYVRDISYDLLMRLINMETAAKTLLEKRVIPEKVSKIMYYIDQEIIQSAINLVNYYGDATEIAQRDSGEVNTVEEPQNTLLSKVSQSLTAPTTVAPLKRTYSSSEPIATQPPKAPDTKPTIDPYREIPEK
jgi:hypothetical protein